MIETPGLYALLNEDQKKSALNMHDFIIGSPMTDKLQITINGLDDCDIPLFAQDFIDWFTSKEENEHLTVDFSVVTDE